MKPNPPNAAGSLVGKDGCGETGALKLMDLDGPFFFVGKVVLGCSREKSYLAHGCILQLMTYICLPIHLSANCSMWIKDGFDVQQVGYYVSTWKRTELKVFLPSARPW